MDQLVIASNEADARAAEAVEQHHAQMAGTLQLRVQAVESAARAGTGDAQPLDELVTWCRDELVPHASAEEGTLYEAARELPEGRLLVEAMLAEHHAIVGLVDELAAAPDPVRAAVLAGALKAVFEVHLAKENDQVLPLLVGSPHVAVAELLDGMHEILGGHEDAGAGDGAGHGAGHDCTCGEADEELPELDARTIPHAIRHATIFGALDTVGAGQGLVLVAPHDPLPLLAQIEARYAGAFTADYLERGPEAWRLVLQRRAA